MDVTHQPENYLVLHNVGDKSGIIFVLYHCRKTKRTWMEAGGVEEMSHIFCFQTRHSILYYLYLLCNTYCVLLFVDYMMNLEGCVSVFELRFCFFLTLLMLCFGVSVTNHQLSNWLSHILMYLVVIVDPWAPACGMWVVILSINVCVMSLIILDI